MGEPLPDHRGRDVDTPRLPFSAVKGTHPGCNDSPKIVERVRGSGQEHRKIHPLVRQGTGTSSLVPPKMEMELDGKEYLPDYVWREGNE